MPSGTRTHFKKALTQLLEDVLNLGSQARRAVARAVQTLMEGDPDLAREVVAADAGINRLRFDIEAECYALLATEQPVARDMRMIVAALTIVNDLERIADHGKKIARIYLRMLDDPRPLPLDDIQRLNDITLAMLDRALQSLARQDTTEAEAVCQADDQADAVYKQVFNATVKCMAEDPRRISAGTHLIQIAHELERVGDRATNVAERVIYTATGELVELNL
jgi:phosphate transport system protein